MNKIINTILLTAFTGSVLVSCSDLDTEPMGNTITAEQKERVYTQNPDMVAASVTGITNMFSVYGNLTSNPDHDDFGYPATMIAMDSRGQDMVSAAIGYNWFRAYLEWRDLSYNAGYSSMHWGTIYNQIYAANQVAILIDPETTDAQLKYFLAQALAIRAYDYFVLAQLYQFTYKGHEQLPCVPIITEANADDAAANGCDLSTVEEVYTQINTDINKAIDLLTQSGIKRSDKRYVDLSVAYAIRARINLVMNNWSEAASDAKYVIDNGGYTPYSLADMRRPSFINIQDNSWIWGILISEEDRVVTSGIVNFPSHMGTLCYGYASVGAWKWCSKKLYEAIPATDVRKGWFIDENLKSSNLNEEEQNYILSNNSGNNPIKPYTQVKFAPYGGEVYTSTNACDIPLIRIEEMYYILAEAQAMGGNPAQGASTLQSFVQTYRDPSYTCTATSATDIQEEIWMQRRIEFWGEGISWFDLKRLGKGINRHGCGYPESAIFTIEGNDKRMNFQIPQGEIEGNAKLSVEKNVDSDIANPTPEVD